jgi:hypothetical protein
MARFTLDEILDNDPLGLLAEIKTKNPIVTADDRLIASFEEINSFVQKHEDEPKRSNDMSERKLYSRLQGLRNDIKKSVLLKEFDRFNLLSPNTIDDILDSDIFGLLEEDEEDIFTLNNVPKITTMPDYVASRKVCKEFDRYRGIFRACQLDLKTGKRKLIKFQNEQQIKEGYYFVLKGILLYVAKVGKAIQSKGKNNARLQLIFENGTESDMLLRSLSAELYKDGKRVTEYDEKKLDGLYNVVDEDKQSGYIYLLKSKSSDDRIVTKKNLYKIGFSSSDIDKRIKNAKNEPTYLMADVEVVAIYECFNVNPQKLEQLLHNFFANSCLNIEIFDKSGKSYYPREWFIAPLDVIDRVVELVISGEIVGYRYDLEREVIIRNMEQE